MVSLNCKIQIGEVGVDSGQVMICDPCYIDSEWKDDKGEDIRRYRDTATGKIYQFQKDFENFESEMADYDGETPNSLRERKVWERIPNDEIGEFSYAGCSSRTLGKRGFGQLNYKMGHAGAGVVSRTHGGDGTYPVFAHFKEGETSPHKLTIEFI